MWLCVCVCVCVCVTVCVWLCVAVCLQVYGELAVRLVAAGDVPAAEQALIGYGSTPVVSALFAPAHTACRLCAGVAAAARLSRPSGVWLGMNRHMPAWSDTGQLFTRPLAKTTGRYVTSEASGHSLSYAALPSSCCCLAFFAAVAPFVVCCCFVPSAVRNRLLRTCSNGNDERTTSCGRRLYHVLSQP